MLSCRDMAPRLSTHSAPACGGKVVAPATKGGISLARQGGWPVFRRPQGSCMVFAAKGGIKMAPKAPYLASAAILYNSRGRSPQPACKAKPITGRTLGAQAKGPAAPSTLARESGRQPSGILESTVPVPIPTAPQAPEPSSPIGACPLRLTRRVIPQNFKIGTHGL